MKRLTLAALAALALVCASPVPSHGDAGPAPDVSEATERPGGVPADAATLTPPIAPTPADPSSPVADEAPMDWALAVYHAAHGGRWFLAVVLGLMAVVLLLRKYSPADWFAGDVRGSALAVGISILGALLTAAQAGQPITIGLIGVALGVAAAAMGGWSGLWKRLVRPGWDMLLRRLRG